jgi:hypothetical protein
MPSTYTLNNGIELIGTGEQSGTWGDTTNTNLGLLDVALDGQVTVALASAGSSGSPNSLPISDGTASNGRNRMVVFSDSGDLGATAYVQLTPNDAEKIIYIRNSLSGSRSVILFQGTYNASNDYEVPAGTTAIVYFDGAGAGAVAANVFNNAYFDGLRLGSVSVTAILDEDNMASDSATALATQQSIKAYVDAQVDTVDTLAEILAIGNTTGATDIAVDSAQKVQFRDAAIYINSSVDGQLDIVADTEIQIAATTIDVNGALDVSGTALVTGVLTTTAATVSNGGGQFNGAINVGVDDTGYDVKFFGATTGKSLLWDESADSLIVTGTTTLVGTTNLDAVDIDGATQIDATVTVGVDDTGYDVKFFGATAGAYMLWDESADDLILGGAAGLSVNSTALVTGVLTTTAATVHTGGITMPNNAKAIFGTGSSLEIYGDGSNSFIKDAGDGDLIIQAYDDIKFQQSTDNADLVTINTGGNVTIHGGNLDVTGTVTADGLGVSGLVTLDDYSGNSGRGRINIGNSGQQYIEGYDSGNAGSGSYLSFGQGASERLRIDNAGNVGIGTSSPATSYKNALQVHGADGGGNIRITNDTTGAGTGNGFEAVVVGIDAYLIQREAAPLIFYTSGAEAMRIDSSGNVGIGGAPSSTIRNDVSSAEKALQIGTRAMFFSDGGLTTDLQNNSHLNNADTRVAMATDLGSLYQQYQGIHKWYNAASVSAGAAQTMTERMRIDASGNLLVGKTAVDFSVDGVALQPSGVVGITRDGGAPLILNRKTSDGDIAIFQKDGAPVGSIGSSNSSSVTYLAGSASGGGIGVANNSPAVFPARPAGVIDDTINLGSGSYRFKNLYLSVGVVFGDAGGSGTSTSNTLDSYEEGTFTPTITSATGTLTTVSATGAYTKVGRLVTASVDITVTTNGTGAGSIVTTLPFTPSSLVQYGTGREVTAVGFTITIQTGVSNAIIVKASDDGYPAGNGYRLKGSVTYSV